MKRRFKRVKAVILTMCLFVGMIGGIDIKPATASAMTTQSAAVNWIRSQKGKAIDMDGAYGAQCVDLIAAYFEYLGVPWRSMTVNYAKDYAWRSLPSGWQRIQGATIQPGDIVIWTGGTTGHVALAISGDRVVEQNYNNLKYCIENAMRWSNYWGVIRPNFNPEALPVERGSRMETGYSRTIADGDYHIVSALDTNPSSIWRQCVTIAGYPPSKENGGNSQLYGCSEEAYQVFTVTWRGNGFYEIKLKYSGKCLDVADGNTANAANVQQWEDNDTDAQQWAIKEADDGIGHTVQTRCSGYYLDVTGGVCANETNIQVYKDIGKTNHAQQWLFIPWNGGDSAKQEVPDGEYEIVTKLDNSKSLHALDFEVVNGTNIVLQERDENNKTSFYVQYLGKGYYRITEKRSGLCLDVNGSYSKSGTNVQLWAPNETDAQQWILKACEDGSFNIISKKATYLDLTGAHTENGTNVAAFNGHGGDNQAWYLLPVEEKQPEIETPSSESSKPAEIETPSSEPGKPTEIETPSSEPGKPAGDEKPSVSEPGKPAEDEKLSVVEPGKPAGDEKPSVVEPGKPAENEKPSVIEPGKPAENEIPFVTPVPTATPAEGQKITTMQVLPKAPATNKPAVAKTLKISSVKCKRKTKKITGKVSVSKATVKIKVGKKVYKRAVVKGKIFKLKLNYKLKKRTKITIKVTKKNYKSLIKCYVVK